MEKEYYDVQDVIDAGYTLEPLRCRHCGSVGKTTFNQHIGDAYCENCGEWQIKEEVSVVDTVEVRITWKTEDVLNMAKAFGISMTQDQANLFLKLHGREITKATEQGAINAGWIVIKTLLQT